MLKVDLAYIPSLKWTKIIKSGLPLNSYPCNFERARGTASTLYPANGRENEGKFNVQTQLMGVKYLEGIYPAHVSVFFFPDRPVRKSQLSAVAAKAR